MPDLKDLRKHREEILKAELAAWLHDVGKFLSAHLKHSSAGGVFKWPCHHSYKIVVDDPKRFIIMSPSAASVKKPAILNEVFNHNCLSTKAADFLSRDLKQWVEVQSISIGTENYSFPELLILGTPGFTTSPHRAILLDKKDGWLIALLGLCHHIAHHEKPEFKKDLIQQKYPYIRLDNPFGFSNHLAKLSAPMKREDCLDAVGGLLLNDPVKAKIHLRRCFKKGWGDTRYPLNEVDLESWSLIVTALFKTQVVNWVITKQKIRIGQWKSWKDKIIDTTASWRLLSIRANGLEYLLSASSISDLKARQELLQDAWDKVKDLLEEEYPLALEVYRDENGPVFVVPDIDNLLGLTDTEYNNKTLREFVLERFRQGALRDDMCTAIEGEIVPQLDSDDAPWDGQSKLPPIEKHLKYVPALKSDPQWVSTQWYNLSMPRERCTVCGLRPQGPSRKARDRKICDVCEKRRGNRAKQWATKGLHTTIWLDEVADENGRIALLVGTFDLTHWLDGTLVRSLAVRNPKNVKNKAKTEDVAKNPSFARLRRIWETTRKFWQEVAPTDKEGNPEKFLAGETIKEKRPRIFLKGTLILSDSKNKSLGPYHAYELEIQGRKVAVLWIPEDAKGDDGKDLPYRGGFWVIENLEYLDNVYGQSFQKLVQSTAGQPLQIYEPTEYGRPGQPVASFTIAKESDVRYLESNYTPIIPILAEPRTFMALVPANRAFEVVKAIKAKYEREMGKVRNRLPIHLGIVFADSHQPLRVILDAGRRFLNQKAKPLVWEVKNITVQEAERENLPPFAEDMNGQFRRWYEVELEAEGRKITWQVPAMMGDGETEDVWYPYVYLESENEPVEKEHYFKAPNPFKSEDGPEMGWVVHVSKLKKGDRIYFTPATFDFVWLGHPGKRFEIAYDKEGKRLGTLNRPYMLDEIEDIEECWNILSKGLSTRQIHLLRYIIESKRGEWTEDLFEEFCEKAVINAGWSIGKEPQKGNGKLDKLIRWAVSGLLSDSVELFLQIMKKDKRW